MIVNPFRAFRALHFGFGSRTALIHTSSPDLAKGKITHPVGFIKQNEIVYPPQKPEEERRPAFVCHQRLHVKYSPDKMWYVAVFVRGMTVDEAIKQLSFVHKKGAAIVKEVILEAQDLAVKKHNVEFKSNLWIAESNVGRGLIMKGIRRHAKGRPGEISYRYCHYFVRLEEGTPPTDFYKRDLPSAPQALDNWLEYMRKRKVYGSL